MCPGEHHCDARYRSPKSVHIKASPQQSTPGLTPELCQLINAEVDVRRAASLDNVCDSSDLDTDDQLQVPSCLPSLIHRRAISALMVAAHHGVTHLGKIPPLVSTSCVIRYQSNDVTSVHCAGGGVRAAACGESRSRAAQCRGLTRDCTHGARAHCRHYAPPTS